MDHTSTDDIQKKVLELKLSELLHDTFYERVTLRRAGGNLRQLRFALEGEQGYEHMTVREFLKEYSKAKLLTFPGIKAARVKPVMQLLATFGLHLKDEPESLSPLAQEILLLHEKARKEKK